MKSSAIINQLVARTWMRHLCIPNFTPPNWWECDLAEFTDGGRFTEFEVKISRSDFAADARKTECSASTWLAALRHGPWLTKHQALKVGHPSGPNRFYFVTPLGLVVRSEIPSWAGWMTINGRTISEVIKAPPLHRGRKTPSEMEAFRKCFYYRYWNLRRSK